MKYRNIKTGNVIDVKGRISGGNWQAVRSAGSGIPARISGEEKTEKAAPAKKSKPTKAKE